MPVPDNAEYLHNLQYSPDKLPYGKSQCIMDPSSDYFLYEMDQALLNKFHKITFIHGVGNGVLRSSIREELKRFPNIRFAEAPQEKFGYGGTEVEFL